MERDPENPRIMGLSLSEEHRFSKRPQRSLRLLEGLGIEGDAHAGKTVKHRSRVAEDPTQPNLRQVHLLQSELLTELRAKGFSIEPGELGENVTTIGVDLLALPTGTLLDLGSEARIEVTGLRNPCVQIDDFRPGMLTEVAHRNEAGDLVRRAGIMAIVLAGGAIEVGDPIRVILPTEPHCPLERV